MDKGRLWCPPEVFFGARGVQFHLEQGWELRKAATSLALAFSLTEEKQSQHSTIA